MLAVPQVGSKLARSACGTKRKLRAAPCASAGAARRGETATAAAPAADVRNLRRFICLLAPPGLPPPACCLNVTSAKNRCDGSHLNRPVARGVLPWLCEDQDNMGDSGRKRLVR